MKLSEFNLEWYRQWATSRTFMEEWSRPGLTNFPGSDQTGNDIPALRHPIFHPGRGRRTCHPFGGSHALVLS